MWTSLPTAIHASKTHTGTDVSNASAAERHAVSATPTWVPAPDTLVDETQVLPPRWARHRKATKTFTGKMQTPHRRGRNSLALKRSLPTAFTHGPN